MSIRKLTLAVVASLFTLTALTPGCSDAPDITKPTSLAISYVSPATGAADRGNEVVIVGAGFQPGVRVTFDGVAAEVSVVDSSRIRATTPVHLAGVVDIVVTNPDGMSRSLSRAFSYLGPTIVNPTIASVNPKSGMAGQAVLIVGTGFGAGAVVTMDGVPAQVVHSDNLSMISAIAPNHGGGPVDVVVANPAGGSATLAGGFVYAAAVLSVSSNLVGAGSEITMSWTTNRLLPDASDDEVCLVDIVTGASVWFYGTLGAQSGERTLTQTQPGQYEFQYRYPDDFVAPYYHVVARSNVVTVVGPKGLDRGHR